MSVMSAKALTTSIRNIAKSRIKLQNDIQEALIACAFYAMKDGNTTPFNDLLKAVGSATRIKGLTMWAETYAPVIVREGAFTLNKSAKKELHVESASDFAPFEAEMRKGAIWCDMVPPEPVRSIFDAPEYLERVIKHLRKNGVAEEVVQIVANAEITARIMKTRAEEAAEEAAEGGEVIEGEAVVIKPALQLAA